MERRPSAAVWQRWLNAGWLPAALAVVVLLQLVSMTTMRDVRVDIQTLNRARWTVPDLEAKWTDADGVEHKVRTPHVPGETAAEHVARHAEWVEAYKAAYPPV